MALLQERACGLAVTIAPGVNAGGTISLPASAGQYHLITSLHFQRACTTPAIAGTAVLNITTTNLPSTLVWNTGNAIATGGTQTDVQISFTTPVKSLLPGVATTFVFPNPGATAMWTATAWYTVE